MEAVVTLEDLFDREFAPITRALAVAFGDPDGAADAVQEAFIEADRRWSTVGGYIDPAAWIRRVAINRLRNGRRNRVRRAEILAAIRPVRPEDLTDDLLDLRRAIDALPEKMRLAVCLHHVAGCTVDDVAAALDVSPGTVKSNLHDARARLRALMEERPHA
jgi:RNA polymerase sigma-70 factor (ECF subfamily)